MVSVLEDESGPPKFGPIENENRTKALRKGLILDMMPHVLALLTLFGRIETTRLTGIKAGRYTYTTERGRTRKASIRKETFAHIIFSLSDYNEQVIQGNAYVGKGIRGSTDLNIEGSVKLLELQGINGNKIRFDLRSSYKEGAAKITVIENSKEVSFDDLYRNAYGTIIRRVVNQRLDAPSMKLGFDMSCELAKNILISIDEMRHPLNRRKQPLPPYHIKRTTDGTSGAPYLEEVVKILDATF